MSDQHAQGSQDQKPESSDEPPKEYIQLKVVGQDSSEIHFKVKMKTPMAKVKKSYSERQGIAASTLRFFFDGKRINDHETPKDLEMENDDVIDVYHEQTGGDNSWTSQCLTSLLTTCQ